MNSLIKPLQTIGFLIIALTVALAANFAYGQWANPTASAPDGNVTAPINVSVENQTKTGNITAWRQKAGDQMWSPWYCSEIGPGVDDIPGTADDFCAKMEDIRALVDGNQATATTPAVQPGNDFIEITFDTSGEYTFVVPAGVDRIEIEGRGPEFVTSTRSNSRRELYASASASSPAYMRNGTQSTYTGSLRNFQPLYQAASSIRSHLQSSGATGGTWTSVGWRAASMSANFDWNGSGSPYLVSVNLSPGSTQSAVGNSRRTIRNLRFDDSGVDISASSNITNPSSWPGAYSSQRPPFSSNTLAWYAIFDEQIESTTNPGSNTVVGGGVSASFNGSSAPQVQTNQYSVTPGTELSISITSPVSGGYVTIRNAS
jgi:hypothetical protein